MISFNKNNINKYWTPRKAQSAQSAHRNNIVILSGAHYFLTMKFGNLLFRSTI